MLRSQALIACLALAGCASQTITLPTYDSSAPGGVDLSGQWRLQDSGEPASDPPEALVNVFLEYGNALKITQTDYGLFVSFDRAIVEEYRFGERREITVGPIEAQRSSGWEGRSYVIETLDSDNMRLTERYRLDARNAALLRVVEIRRRQKQLFKHEQAFARD
jgi:hypothetical protein